MIPLPRSVAAGVTTTELTFCQAEDPPAALTVGAVRSIRTCAGALQSDTLPALSATWNSTRVSPSAVMVAVDAVVVPDQFTPPFVDVRYAYVEALTPLVAFTPAAGRSVALGVITTDAALCQVVLPPVVVTVGLVLSMLAVLAAPLVSGHGVEVLPALSTARICTYVVPSPETVAAAPVADQFDQFVPSDEVRN